MRAPAWAGDREKKVLQGDDAGDRFDMMESGNKQTLNRIRGASKMKKAQHERIQNSNAHIITIPDVSICVECMSQDVA